MKDDQIQNLKKNIIAIGRLLWEKELVTGLNGNISARVDEKRLLLTAHGTCLGLLKEDDILLVDLDGNILAEEEGSVSTEKLLHTEVYRNFPDITSIVHTHTPYANAYFLRNPSLKPEIFESRFYLGQVHAVKQSTPSVTDMQPVLEVLKNNNIVALQNHGIVAIGKDLFDCFLLIQALEDAVKVDAISRLYSMSSNQITVPAGGRDGKTKKKGSAAPIKKGRASRQEKSTAKKYKLFSKEQIDKIVDLINKDTQLAELGEKTKMTFDLAVQMNETGQTHSFRFQNGRITKVWNGDDVEFLITAPERVWRSVFNREIDPFVATTQKKMHLRGDFAKISKWYAPCSRVFEIWQEVPVE